MSEVITISEWIKVVLGEIKSGAEQAKEVGVTCILPSEVEFDLMVNGDNLARIGDPTTSRVKFTVKIFAYDSPLMMDGEPDNPAKQLLYDYLR